RRFVSRAGRTIAVVLGTLLLLVAALLYPVLSRGETWYSAVWTVPVLAWLPHAARLPVLAGIAAVLAGVVVWRMTLAADARTPRMRIAAVAPLLTGPRGLRTRLRDLPGMLRGTALVFAILALGRPENVLRGENADEKGIDMVVVLDLSGSMRA